jgi:hypothetical protein
MKRKNLCKTAQFILELLLIAYSMLKTEAGQGRAASTFSGKADVLLGLVFDSSKNFCYVHNVTLPCWTNNKEPAGIKRG